MTAYISREDIAELKKHCARLNYLSDEFSKSKAGLKNAKDIRWTNNLEHHQNKLHTVYQDVRQANSNTSEKNKQHLMLIKERADKKFNRHLNYWRDGEIEL